MKVLQANGKFDEVARTIAKGDPPGWLLVGLEHFSDGIGVNVSADERRRFDHIIGDMQRATTVLTTWLPMWAQAGYGLKCREDVALALYVLPRIKEDLDKVGWK